VHCRELLAAGREAKYLESPARVRSRSTDVDLGEALTLRLWPE